MVLGLSQTGAALDRWQDRVVLICYFQTLGAFVYMALEYVFPPIAGIYLGKWKDPAPPRWKLPLVILTFLLPFASRYANLKNLRLRRISENPIDPLCLAPIQLLQVVICTFLLAYNFVQDSVHPLRLCYSSVFCFLPSIIGFVYSLLGIARFYLNSSSQRFIARHRIATNQYFDDSLEVGPLEHAYQALQVPVHEDIMSQEIDEPFSDSQEGDHIRVQSIQSRSRQPVVVQNREPQSHPAAAHIAPANTGNSHRDNQMGTSALPDPVRFRWQEQVAAHNGGRNVWAPIVIAKGLSVLRLGWFQLEMQAFIRGGVYMSRKSLV